MEKEDLFHILKKRIQLPIFLKKKKILTKKLNLIEKKKNMLTGVIDLDYLEIVYRIKFMVGKKGEKILVE